MDKNGKKGFTRRIKRSINGIKQFFMAKKNSLASNGGLFGALRSGFARMGSWFVKLKPLLRASLCIALVIVIATPIALALMPSGDQQSSNDTGGAENGAAAVLNVTPDPKALNTSPYLDESSALPFLESSDNEDGSTKEASVQATPTVKPTTEPTPTPVPIMFTKGDNHDDIMEIQLRLMGLFYMDSDEPTDYFGPQTEEAIKVFQRRHELKITGVIDKVTYDLLMSSGAKTCMVGLGDEGTDVKELQERLYELDYISAVTGYFGSDTEEAVKKFQEKNNLTVDGKVGAETREALYSENAKANALSYGTQSPEVKQYQEILKRLGYLTTEPDGTYGNDMVAAVKRFQERNGLIPDGYLGPKTKKLLLSGDAQANALMIGMSGDDVENVQRLLKKWGYLNESSCTGYYGSVTEYAVKEFQRRNGLSVDGKVGRQSMKVLTGDNVKGPSSGYQVGGGSGGNGNGGGNGGGGGGDSSTTSSVEQLIKVARTKLGSRYVRGGKGPNTFDCSGFVYWCLNKAGVSQPYLTSHGWRSVTHYRRISSMNDVKRGDILVFRMSSSQGHVGIALGGGRMIDASSNLGKVVERSHTTNYWQRYFLCAYRIF